MKRRSKIPVTLLACAFASLAARSAAALEMPVVFGDRMVLQAGTELPIWGSAPPGTEVSVRLADRRRTAVADTAGSWRVALPPLPPGGPHELVVEADQTVRFTDVMVGEVWLASGQSNMAMPLAGWGRILDYEIEIARADYPEIRWLQVDRATAMNPSDDVRSAGWQRSSPETVAEFSSTAYFFARRLHRETGLPIGIIHSSWGGTVAEAWTSAGTLESMDDFRQAVREVRSTTPRDLVEQRRAYQDTLAARRRAMATHDTGLADGRPLWTGPDFDHSTWATMELPSKWEDAAHPDLDGVVWFRREFQLPEGWAGSDLTLHLGYVEDDDQTFVNGEPVGSTEGWSTRHYQVPAEQLRPGRNVITVRVMDAVLYGGIWGDPGDLRLERADGQRLPLAGPWRYRIGLDLLDLPELGPAPRSPDDPNRPSVLYNGMIEPLAPYALRGVIWYQGESNSSRAFQYRRLFPALIRDWRATWGQPTLPFYFVQLAAFEPGAAERGKWPELREAQALALELPDTGMAVAIDIGNPRDVHPKNKQEVGNRLARLALRRIYGEEIADSGPLYRDLQREGRRIRLRFEHTYGGLEAKRGALTGFAVAGADRQFHAAEARIEDESVVVWSEPVAEPVAVRYGWADSPDCNLYNAVGLPAAPFRTDDWPGLTWPADPTRE